MLSRVDENFSISSVIKCQLIVMFVRSFVNVWFRVVGVESSCLYLVYEVSCFNLRNCTMGVVTPGCVLFKHRYGNA